MSSSIATTTFCVPINGAQYSVEGCCFVSKQAIQWMGQLLEKYEGRYTLHVDGKHKLHHGKWVLTTLGVHTLRDNSGTGNAGQLSTTFVPLVYLFSKQVESDGAALMLCDSSNVIAMKYYGKPLRPGAVMSGALAWGYTLRYLHHICDIFTTYFCILLSYSCAFTTYCRHIYVIFTEYPRARAIFT